MQAQDYPGAKWALSQRLGGMADAEIERDIAAGRILRTHVLRPTWHFVAPQDLRWMLALTGPRVKRSMASYNLKMELGPAVLRRARGVVERALRGTALTRTALRAHLERAKIGPMNAQRLAHVMMDVELDAVVCSGPREGRDFTYALVDERVPTAAPMERDEALGELARRYFATRSPASARDFAWWSGLTAADARRAIEIVGKELEPVAVGGNAHWLWRDFESPRGVRSAHLLPNYDEYFIGFKDRSAAGQRLGSAALVTGGDFLVLHIILVDGQLVGGWRRETKGGETIVRATYLDRVTPAERKRIAAAAEMLAAHLGVPVRVEATERIARPR